MHVCRVKAPDIYLTHQDSRKRSALTSKGARYCSVSPKTQEYLAASHVLKQAPKQKLTAWTELNAGAGEHGGPEGLSPPAPGSHEKDME